MRMGKRVNSVLKVSNRLKKSITYIETKHRQILFCQINLNIYFKTKLYDEEEILR